MRRIVLIAICLMLSSTTGFADWDPGDPYAMHSPQLPNSAGWAVAPMYCYVADDWVCIETGPVTQIHFWGSYKSDAVPPPVTFAVNIYNEDPSGACQPGDLVWSHIFSPEQYAERLWLESDQKQDFYLPDWYSLFPEDHYKIYQYNIEIPVEEAFVQQIGEVYWLAIGTPLDYQGVWGWKTSLDHFGADALWRCYASCGWEPWSYSDTTDVSNLAFVISTSTNALPEAWAGDDQSVEQESCEGTEVTLDGSGSTDPDSTPGTNDDIVAFDWYEGDNLLGSGEWIPYTFSPGAHTVTLVVTDSAGEMDDDEVIITVQDTTPPEVSVSIAKDSLWPPSHKMVDVGFGFNISDICNEETDITIGITSDEPTATAPGAGGTKHAPDAEFTDDGLLLRAERSGNGDGRVYVITVTATDVSGNSASGAASVKVNHNKKKEAVDSGQDYDATETK